MTGNCLGWVIYAYYTEDPFVLMANLPALIMSLWLNMGAAKLQYHALKQHEERRNEDWADASGPEDDDEGVALTDGSMQSVEGLVFVPQEVALLRILSVWGLTAAAVGWILPAFTEFTPKDATVTVGLLVQTNLVVFLGAPLQSLRTVVTTKVSDSIHRPTLTMNYLNCTFWILYGAVIRRDIMIVLPNMLGLMLGIAQGLLCFIYPLSTSTEEPDEASPAQSVVAEEEIEEQFTIT